MSDNASVRRVLEAVAGGRLSIAEGLAALRPSEDLGFACLDLERAQRCNMPEAIFGSGKQPEQIAEIMQHLNAAGQNAFVTRVEPACAAAVLQTLSKAVYHPEAHALTCDVAPLPEPQGCVAVCCAGTTDIPVAAEASLTAERMGARVEQFYDIGVAGLHRLLRRLELLREARVLVVAAGMEGALPSVIGGLVSCPIIAVPTSIGYGASFGGMAALLGMLNSCAPGVSVVNIDNGFGAGVVAARINNMGAPRSDA